MLLTLLIDLRKRNILISREEKKMKLILPEFCKRGTKIKKYAYTKIIHYKLISD